VYNVADELAGGDMCGVQRVREEKTRGQSISLNNMRVIAAGVAV